MNAPSLCVPRHRTAGGSAAGQQNYVSIYTAMSGKTCVKHIDDKSTGPLPWIASVRYPTQLIGSGHLSHFL
jgi:hypothetical protein